MTTRKLITAVTAGLLVSVIAQADIYRWQDAAGTVHYSDTPPEGVNAVLVDIQSSPTDKARIAEQRRATIGAQQARKLIEAEQQYEGDEQAATEEEQRKAREDACLQARERLERYNASPRLYQELEDGEREWLTEEQANQARERAAKSVADLCK